MNSEQFLEMVVKEIARNPESVRVERTVDDMGVLLKLHVHREDMGMVIGQRGVTGSAIRLLCKLKGLAGEERISVKIMEPI